MTHEQQIKAVLDADDIAWGQTKLDYAEPNSTVDMGELFFWANRWHEKYYAAMQVREMTVEDVYSVIYEALLLDPRGTDDCLGTDAKIITDAFAKLGTIRIVEE